MDQIAREIVEQVQQLEELRDEGSIDHDWYLRTRAVIVRRHRELRRAALGASPDPFRSTLELSQPA